MLMAAILLLGLSGYELLPLAVLPNIDSPTIRLPGADAQRGSPSMCCWSCKPSALLYRPPWP
jgi:HAE1 family hydrophobic/amphiphilic exporter-1